MYLFLAIVLFWSFIVLQVVGLIHAAMNYRFRYKHTEAQRLIEESPYLQHLGFRPPRAPLPIKVWAAAFAVWNFGIFLITQLNWW